MAVTENGPFSKSGAQRENFSRLVFRKIGRGFSGRRLPFRQKTFSVRAVLRQQTFVFHSKSRCLCRRPEKTKKDRIRLCPPHDFPSHTKKRKPGINKPQKMRSMTDSTTDTGSLIIARARAFVKEKSEERCRAARKQNDGFRTPQDAGEHPGIQPRCMMSAAMKK